MFYRNMAKSLGTSIMSFQMCSLFAVIMSSALLGKFSSALDVGASLWGSEFIKELY